MLVPPVRVALARREPRLPRAAGLAFEPKVDGWRVVLLRDGDGMVAVQARSGRLLTEVLPDLAAAASRELPVLTVVDGEAIAAGPDGELSFGAMQTRGLASPTRARRLARQSPVTYAAFDVLVHRGRDVRPLPYRERRAILVELLPAGRPEAVLQPVPTTEDPEVALGWWHVWQETPGLEGMLVKRLRGRYESGRREWVKVKYAHAR